MRFVPWYPLSEAEAHAPRAPGVFQVRVEAGLVEYPTGRSAMIHYGAAADVRRAVAELAAAHPGAPWLCRHAVELTPRESADPEAALAVLLDRFRRRFGMPPTFPPAPLPAAVP